MSYPFKEIEAKWQKIWEEREDYVIDLDSTEKKLFCLVMFSYPSAKKLHLGHWYNYGPTDTWARLKRMQGYNVFEPMGYDAFGLPAENYAVKRGVHPALTTKESIEYIREQLKEIGAMYDWTREVNTSSPDYYKWTQWLFLLLYKRGLAYQKQAPVNWCPECQTVLANEQVLAGGDCERCGTIVVKRDLKQWFFKITDYADRLIEGHDKIDWPAKTVAQQRHWIGRSEGANIKFKLVGHEGYIETFTTRADTLFGVTHIVLAPELPIVDEITSPERLPEVQNYVERARNKSDIERVSEDRDKTGVFTGAYAINPLSGEKVQVWIADYVLATYGTGAVMAVPAHDQRDFEFAKKFNFNIKVVIQDSEGSIQSEKMTEAFTDYGTMVNSGEFNGLNSEAGKTAVAKKLEAMGQGGLSVTYHLRDWLVSRQRFWGAPIPIIHCSECGAVPVPEHDLPVLLPAGDIDFKPQGKSPLAAVDEFMQVKCSECGRPALRDPDTMDTFVCSSWYFLRYTSTEYEDRPFDSERVNKWFPIDRYVGGADHTNGHLLYSRFITKVLYDEGLINFDEPFQSLRHQGVITHTGAKMSKSKGNVVNPDDFIEKFGSDVLRLYVMFMGDYEQGGDWSDTGIIGIERFVNRVWRLYEELLPIKDNKGHYSKKLDRYFNIAIKSVAEDIENLKFNTAIARLMEFVNEFYSYLTENREHTRDSESISKYLDGLSRIIAPLAPHLGEELYSFMGGIGSVFDTPYPDHNPEALIEDFVEIAVQINGKLRATIEIKKGSDEDEAVEAALGLENIKKYIEGKNMIKKIYIKGRLLNLVIR